MDDATEGKFAKNREEFLVVAEDSDLEDSATIDKNMKLL
jgi:hypothetical protein